MADELRCGICGASRPRGSCHIITLSDEERATLGTTRRECVYCKPCWRTLSDPAGGTAYTKGMLTMWLRQLGVGNAEELAERYTNRLIAARKQPPS